MRGMTVKKKKMQGPWDEGLGNHPNFGIYRQFHLSFSSFRFAASSDHPVLIACKLH